MCHLLAFVRPLCVAPGRWVRSDWAWGPPFGAAAAGSGILSVQLMVTFGMVAVFCFNDTVKLFVQTNPGMFYLAIFLQVGLMCGLICCPKCRTEVPYNFLFLFAFTVVEGYLIGPPPPHRLTPTHACPLPCVSTARGRDRRGGSA